MGEKMNNNSKRGIGLFLAAAFLDSLCFYAPVASLYRLAFGMTLFQITVTESCFFAVSMLLELPWGFLTERIGCKTTLVIAGAFHLAAQLLFLAADSFWLFLLQRCVLAAAASGCSGCDAAYLSSLSGHGAEHRVLGYYQAVSFAAVSIAGLFFPLAVRVGYRGLAALTAVSVGTAFFLRCLLPDIQGSAKNCRTAGQQIREVGEMLLENKAFLVFVVSGAVLSETEHTFTVFFSSPAWQAAAVPEMWYGALNVMMNLAGLGGSLASVWLSGRQGEKRGRAVAVFWALAVFSSAGLWAAGESFWCVLLFPVFRFAAQGYLPCEQSLKLCHTGKAGKAASLSAYNLIISAAGILLGPVIGACTRQGLSGGFFAGGLLLLTGAALTAAVWRKI